jgi:hypothetical protein
MDREITWTDITRAAEERDPQLAELVVAYLEQPDPPENIAEEQEAPEEEAAEEREPPPLPEGSWTMDRLRATLNDSGLAYKTESERKAIRREAWEGILSAPHPPPRLQLGQLLVQLYERGDERARAALVEIFRRAKLGWGLWQGFKRIYKLAEERHDAPLFGVLAWRLDAMGQTPSTREISGGTHIYMRRRAWRYLRQLGQALPEIYPLFAAQVLRHYPRGATFYDSWVASQIWAHEDLKFTGMPGYSSGPPKDLKKRAFDEAWKLSPEPLLRLLEDAENDQVCDFAIRSLQRDFPGTLREVDARWLARIGRKPLASVHEFVVKLLTDSPEFHQSKLKGLGLHEMVLGLLRSESAAARRYAVEYARAHAPDIGVEELVSLAEEGAQEVQQFAAAWLEGKAPAEIGLPALVRLLGVAATEKLASEKIQLGFKPQDLDAELFIQLVTGNKAQNAFVERFFKDAKQRVPARFYCALLDDRRCSYKTRRLALTELGQRAGAEIGLEWIKQALVEPALSSAAASWLRAGMFKGDELDVEWLKGLVMRPGTRPLALELLGNPKLVAPSRVGLGWLLALARQSDESVSRFAHHYLLQHFTPEEFAREAGSSELEAGVDRLWRLAAGPDEPEPVREFAATYLKVHHPQLGPQMAEARSLGIAPRLTDAAYGLARVRPLFLDARADVRRLAVAIGRQELVRWGDRGLPYELADSSHREPRALAADALLGVGQPEADPRLVPPEAWLAPARVFALAESPVKATREIALTLVRRHYGRLGGARRLAWLMESPDREVRLFAVRLLWEKHRPRDLPESWRPPKPVTAGGPEAWERFDSVEALRQFLRTVMFGLPPGRMERRELDTLPDRPLPASVAKRRLLEVVRDMAVEDEAFAQVALPVLVEFSHSQAKGEWQGCVAALARIRRAHPSVQTVVS